MATSNAEPADLFLLNTVDLDAVTVGRTEDGRVEVSRALHDETPTTMEDVCDLATEHGLGVVDVRTDPDAGTVTIVFEGGQA